MTPERYNQVKEIFLSACEKPREQQPAFVERASGGDAEIKREVESLLTEHGRETQVIPQEPEGPLGSMSAILSRANIDLAGGHVGPKHDRDGGAGTGGRDDPTTYIDDSSSGSQDTSSGIVDAGRFMAGTVAAGRYRIIELLGRGGMGEVYRADDIMLNQSIALKFLPALFGTDQKWLERFRNEVRLARQVTHPNVCRVFDIGEFQGEQFISMEYVDGENLASLLRRIGRLPHDKAMQIARQLCAGLAAAHDRGVLHRDLKPANVMIDGRGAVRITDFGLAAPVDQLRAEVGGAGGAVRAGTPAYMSPEQLANKPVTVRSDVYSLGLVLYEMFTGRRAFRAENLREYQKLHSSGDPTPPSVILDDIDPIVERVIMKCLEKDPRNRPASAMAVSAALPGGNPLREILAAGETPSPEVVAAAGETHGMMRPRTAVALLMAALVCLVGFVWMAPRVFVVQQALNPSDRSLKPLQNSGIDHAPAPEILNYKAQQLLTSLGYTDKPQDWAEGFDVNRGYYLHVEQDQRESRLWQLWRPRLGMVYYWYRQSPELLIPSLPDGRVIERDPPPGLPGMIKVRLDPLGRLIGLEAEPRTPAISVPVPETAPEPATGSSTPSPLPATRTASSSGGARTDWTPLLDAAGIDLSQGSFRPAMPQGAPPVFADERAAWEGNFDEYQTVRSEMVRVEAAAYHGRPVYFAVIGKWKEEQLSEEKATIQSVGQWNLRIQTAVIVSLLVAGSLLAWKNYNSGRGDRPGASRMAMAFFLLGVVAWLCRAHHVTDPVEEFILFERGMGPVLYLVSLMWIFYMALEPYVRRVWPETVISWSRLLSGKWIDPLVGRDVLAGAAVGVITTLLSILENQIPQWLGPQRILVPLPSITSISQMLNATQDYAGLFSSAIASLYLGLIVLLFLVLMRMMTRRRWVAAAAFILLFAVATAHYRVDIWWKLKPENVMSLVIQAVLALVLFMILMRHGLVAVIFCLLVRELLTGFPVTWDFSAWYAGTSAVAIGTVVLILGLGFYAAIGGRSLPHWREESRERVAAR